MRTRHTQESYIEKCKEVHENKFSYSKVVYTGSQCKIIVTCPEHGDFQTPAQSHLYGHGCMDCYRKRQGDTRRMSHEEWLARSNEAHDNYYDYSLVDYKNQNQKITVICPKHGNFESVAGTHMRGQAYCKKCRTRPPGTPRSTQDHYLAKVKEVHGDKYDYSRVSYTKLQDKIEVVCKKHGAFLVRAGNHVSGRGCPRCASHGFKVHKPAFLYVLKFDNITKIGVTNGKIGYRAAKIRKSSGKMFRVATSFEFPTGEIALGFETLLLKELRVSHEQPKEIYDGSTESFYDVDLLQLFIKIRILMKQLNEQNSSSTKAQ